MTDPTTQLAEVNDLKSVNAGLIRKWMEAAAQCLNPQAVTGKDFNRTGELLMAAGQQLEAERKRLAEEIRRAELRQQMAQRTTQQTQQSK